jgi:hypothetical protein
MPLRAASGRDGDNQGDGQPKGVGAGDHQHRDGPLHRLVGLAKGQPDDQGDEPGPEGEPEQPPGRPVGQGLGPRAGGLGLRDQPADPGHRRCSPTASTRTRIAESVTTVPATTRVPGCLASGPAVATCPAWWWWSAA